LPKLNIVAPKFGDSEIFKLAAEKTRLKKPNRVKLDKIDVIIVAWKIKYVLTKLAEITRKYHGTCRLNKQLLSYRFKKHSGKNSSGVATFLHSIYWRGHSCSYRANPCHMYVDIYKLFSMFDVEIPLGDLIIDPTNLVVNPVNL